MKEIAGKILYYVLLVLIGVSLIIGGIINVKGNNGFIAVFGCFAVGIGMALLGVQGLVIMVKGR